MKPIIRVENLGKRYRLGRAEAAYATLRESLVGAVRAPFDYLRRGFSRGKDVDRSPETFWALNDVSFEVMPGEVVGVIGRNGAGKSTLLKVLSRITEPTTGGADLFGRLASLLEVGTAFFHAELSGRENIYLSGAILGMRRREIARKFDEIVEFAEIGRFLDTPVKRYSSGMYVRLGFAVAAFLESEILVVDEVLSVGDAAFQKKCLGKMGDVAGQGRTVLFVSHNMLALQNLCTRALWLDQGALRDEGNPAGVISHYLQTSYSPTTEKVWTDPATAPGNEKVRMRRILVRPVGGSPNDPITAKTAFEVEAQYWNLIPDMELSVYLNLFNEYSQVIFTVCSSNDPRWHGSPFPVGLFSTTCQIPGSLLIEGTYRFSALIAQNNSIILINMEEILTFEIQPASDPRNSNYIRQPGVIRPDLAWATELVGCEVQASSPPG